MLTGTLLRHVQGDFQILDSLPIAYETKEIRRVYAMHSGGRSSLNTLISLIDSFRPTDA